MLLLDTSKGHTFEICYQQVKVCIEIGIDCMDHDPRKRPTTRYIIDLLDNKREMKQPVRIDICKTICNSSPKKVCVYIGVVAYILSPNP